MLLREVFKIDLGISLLYCQSEALSSYKVKKNIYIYGARDTSSRVLSLVVVVMAAWCYDGNGGAGNGSCIGFSVNKCEYKWKKGEKEKKNIRGGGCAWWWLRLVVVVSGVDVARWWWSLLLVDRYNVLRDQEAGECWILRNSVFAGKLSVSPINKRTGFVTKTRGVRCGAKVSRSDQCGRSHHETVT